VVRRSGVSKRAFFEVFQSEADCFSAAFEEGLGRLSRTVLERTVGREHRLERVRGGLVALLGFFDDEPRWGRLLVLEAPVTGSVVLECQRRLLAVLTGLLDEVQPQESGGSVSVTALTGELVAGGVFCVIRGRMLEADGEPFVELAPSLLSFIAAQYGAPALAFAPARSEELARAAAISRAAEMPIRATHRTTLVLRAIAQAPYSNNREIAQTAGLSDEGQTSKLLARLERQGAIENVGIGAARGEPNAWLLTPSGRRALELIGESFASGAPPPRSTPARGTA
jgi:AcrR family transcriptional regulator